MSHDGRVTIETWAGLTGDVIIQVDARGVVTAAAGPVASIFGHDQVVVGTPLQDLVHSGADEIHSLLSGLRGSTAPGAGRLVTETGTHRVSGTALDHAGTVVVRVIRDDTARARFRALTETVHRLEEEVLRRRRAEQDLAERSRLLRTIIDHAPASIYVKDLRGRYVEANRACAANHGVDGPSQVIGRTDRDLFDPAEAELVVAADRAIVEGGEARVAEEHLSTRAGRFTFLSVKVPLTDEHGRVYGLVGVSTDITERARADELLRDREAQLAVAHRIAKLATWRLDPSTDVVETSPEMATMLGLDRSGPHRAAELTAMTHPDDLETAAREIDEVIAGTPIDSTTRFLRPDGSVVWVRNRSDARSDAEGRLVGTLQDVTEEVLAEQRRQELEARLHRTQRLESIGQLAGGVAHDFNNLLAVAKLHAELALEQPDAPDLGDHLAQVLTAVDRATDLTRRLLTFSRRPALGPSVPAIDVEPVIAETMTLVRRSVGEHIEIAFDPSGRVPPVAIDPSQLEQVLMNLVVNARDAMPSGGRLTVTTRPVDDVVGTGSSTPVPGVEITVSDTGAGMDAEVRERAMEPFFTTRADHGGTGLGLATVHGVVTGAGGTVTLRSEAGRGTSVSVRLPAGTGDRAVHSDTATDPDPSGPTRRASGASSRALDVVVVEDQAALAGLVARLLQRRGHRVRVASDGREALDLLDDVEHVDVVLTDVIMPSMSGGELADRLAERHPDLAVRFMSGYAGDDATHARVRSAEVLHKPFSGDQLVEFVERAAAPSDPSDAPGDQADG